MCAVLYDERRQTCFVVVLQNCIGFVEGGTGACNEAGVECDMDRTEVSTEDEDAIDVMDETPEAISFPTIKNEQEVRLWGLCEVVAAHAFRPFIAQKLNCEIMPVSCFVLCFGCHISLKFGLNPEGKRLFGSHSY